MIKNFVFGGNYFACGEFVLYINHSGTYIEINSNVKIPFSSLRFFPFLRSASFRAASFLASAPHTEAASHPLVLFFASLAGPSVLLLPLGCAVGICGCFFPFQLSLSGLCFSAPPWVVLRFFLWFLGDSPLSSTAPAAFSRSPLGFGPSASPASSSTLRCLFLSLAFRFLLRALRLTLFFLFTCAVGWRCVRPLLLLWLMFGFRFPFGLSPFLLVASPLFPFGNLS